LNPQALSYKSDTAPAVGQPERSSVSSHTAGSIDCVHVVGRLWHW